MEGINNFFENAPFVWSILSAVIGGLIGFFSKRFHIRYEAKMKAANELKLTFAPIIYWLQNESATAGIHTAGRLKDSKNEIDSAIGNFSVHFTGRKLYKFLSTCETFYKKAGDKNKKYYGYAMIHDNKEAAKEAMKNIEAILKFTK